MPRTQNDLKQRLLAAAKKLFAKQGRDAVSLREIADCAGVSHGSVRYHFGTKEELYQASLTHSDPFKCEIGEQTKRPQRKRIPRDEAVAQFKQFVRSLVAYEARVGSNKAVAMGLLQAEVARGEGPDPTFYKEVIAPGHERMKSLIQSINPKIRKDKALEMIAFNVIFQCVMVRTARGIILRRLKTKSLSKHDISQIAETIIETTLGGIHTFGY